MTAEHVRTARPDTASPDSPLARLLTRLTSRVTDRLLGTALAVAACDPPAALHASPLVKTLVVGAALAAWWAAPMVDTRPVRTSTHWRVLAARRRTTVLPAAAIAVTAITGPPFWLVACVAALLLAYLLATDPWTAGVTAPAGYPRAAPALTATAGTAVVLLVAQAPVAATAWARLPASLAVAATVACLVLALRSRRSPRG
ncbi:hypothetical protein ACWEGS_25705 [Streptomyces sp. NPDC004822]